MAANRRTANRLVTYSLTACVAVFALVFLSGAVQSTAVAAKAVWAALTAATLPLLWRTLRAGVLVTGGSVVVRNWLTTTRIAPTDILETAVGSSRNISGQALCVTFHLHDGSLVRAMATASYSRRKVEGYRREIGLTSAG